MGSRSGAAEPFQTIVLPDASAYEFKPAPNDVRLYVYEPKHAILYIVDTSSFLPLQDSINNVRDFRADGEDMVYWNDFELWAYNSVSRARTLLTRISQPINDALFVNQYAFYNTSYALNSLERGDRDFLNQYVLLDWRDVSDMALSPNGKYLYFVSPLDDKKGLYKLEIK